MSIEETNCLEPRRARGCPPRRRVNADDSITRLRESFAATQVAFNKYKQYSPDFTSALYDIDVACSPACSKFGKYSFFNDQFSALSSWRTRATSNFHGLEILVRKRFSAGTQFDFNYTMSKSLDLSSPTERDGAYAGFSVNAPAPDNSEPGSLSGNPGRSPCHS